MHRARSLPSTVLDYDWYHPRIRFVRVPRDLVNVVGPFEASIRELAKSAAKRCGRWISDDPDLILMPVHELQIPNIVSKFPDVDVLHGDISLQAYAQSSIR